VPPSPARRPTLIALAACLAAAGISFLLEPFALLPDPWAWVVWGRELLRVDLDTTSGPSWKPLPVLIVAVLSLAQGAAPVLWVLVARAGALLAFVMAWRVARRLAGPAAGWVAAAALAVALLPSWMNIAAMGREEGLLCALVLWAIERHLAGREGRAFAPAFGAALLRPEAWPFLGLYGLWLLWRRPRLRMMVIGLLLALAPLWFLPYIVTVGDPLQSSQKAQGGISGTTLTEPVRRAYELVPPTLQLAALASAVIAFLRVRRMGPGVALAARESGAGAAAGERVALAARETGARTTAGAKSRAGVVPTGEREVTVLALFAGALVWIALVAVTSKIASYAGIARFQHPAAAVVCTLAGVGAVWVAGAVREALARRRPSSPAGAVAAALVAAVLVAGTLPTLPTRVRRIDRVVKEERARADLDGTLGDAVDAAGGRVRVVACGSSYTNAGNEPALAWHLERHIAQVSSDRPKVPGAVVRVDPQALRTTRVRRLGIALYPVRDRTFDPIGRAGVWQLLAACRPGETLGRVS
jgi:hypothetical protein